jgi:glyoxylase-like metal-dependent hydrolase (beta-lactamase superfamily II)
VSRLIRHPHAQVTLSDAGAHLSFLCDAGFGLHLFGHWARERGDLTLEQAVQSVTSRPAELYRIRDRGRLVRGAWADLILFDPAAVGRGPEQRVFDLPAGASRIDTPPAGLHGVWVNGTRVVDAKGPIRDAGRPGMVREHPGHLRQVFEDSVRPVIDSGQPSTVRPAGEAIAEGLRFVPTNGHTAGHMSIWLESGADAALFSGDVMHHPVQVYEPQLSSVFCDFPGQAVRTRLNVLAEVAERRAHYFSPHFPDSSVGVVERLGDTFVWRFARAGNCVAVLRTPRAGTQPRRVVSPDLVHESWLSEGRDRNAHSGLRLDRSAPFLERLPVALAALDRHVHDLQLEAVRIGKEARVVSGAGRGPADRDALPGVSPRLRVRPLPAGWQSARASA